MRKVYFTKNEKTNVQESDERIQLSLTELKSYVDQIPKNKLTKVFDNK